MNTDRQLLELAAKAAELAIVWYGESDPWCYAEIAPGIKWNPITDDGDALRLAVNLEITIMFDHYSVWCEQYGILEKYGGDRLAATRLAIVKAAAEIGRNTR